MFWKPRLLTIRSTAHLAAFAPAVAGFVARISGRKEHGRALFNINTVATGAVVKNNGILPLYVDACSKAADRTSS